VAQHAQFPDRFCAAAELSSPITGAIWYGFWHFLAQAAQLFVASAESVSSLAGALPAALMFIFLLAIGSLVSASLGASLDPKKLLVYPIPTASCL
jgi:hypothetical protein